MSYIGLAADGLLPGDGGDRRQPDRRHQHPGHRRARPGADLSKGKGTVPATGHDTHSTTASLTRFTLPNDRKIAGDTVDGLRARTAGRTDTDVQAGQGRRARRPCPVPTRIGDPSTIKHVFLMVKENRTYDQVYGDMSAGQRRPDARAVRREGHTRTSTRWRRSSGSTTTRTTSAPTRPRATTG